MREENNKKRLLVSGHAWDRFNFRKPEHGFETLESFEIHLNNNLSNKYRSMLSNLPIGKERILRLDGDFYPVIVRWDGSWVVKSFIPHWMQSVDPSVKDLRIIQLQKQIASLKGQNRELWNKTRISYILWRFLNTRRQKIFGKAKYLLRKGS